MDKILEFKDTTARSKVKSKSHNDVAHPHSLQPMFLQRINLLHLTVLRCNLGKTLKVETTTARSKIKIKATS